MQPQALDGSGGKKLSSVAPLLLAKALSRIGAVIAEAMGFRIAHQAGLGGQGHANGAALGCDVEVPSGGFFGSEVAGLPVPQQGEDVGIRCRLHVDKRAGFLPSVFARCEKVRHDIRYARFRAMGGHERPHIGNRVGTMRLRRSHSPCGIEREQAGIAQSAVGGFSPCLFEHHPCLST